jgi:hypothetical protein
LATKTGVNSNSHSLFVFLIDAIHAGRCCETPMEHAQTPEERSLKNDRRAARSNSKRERSAIGDLSRGIVAANADAPILTHP